MNTRETLLSLIQNISQAQPLKSSWWQKCLQKIHTTINLPKNDTALVFGYIALSMILPLFIQSPALFGVVYMICAASWFIILFMQVFFSKTILAYYRKRLYASEEQKDNLLKHIATHKMWHNIQEIDIDRIKNELNTSFMTEQQCETLKNALKEDNKEQMQPCPRFSAYSLQKDIIEFDEFRSFYSYQSVLTGQHKLSGLFASEFLQKHPLFFGLVAAEQKQDLLEKLKAVKRLYPQTTDCVNRYEAVLCDTQNTTTIQQAKQLNTLLDNLLFIQAMDCVDTKCNQVSITVETHQTPTALKHHSSTHRI